MTRFLAMLLLFAAPPALACGPDSDCALGDRHYRIYEPPTIKHPGAIIFAHGYRGNAAGIMKSKGFRAMADRLGVRLVSTKSYSQDWRIPGVPERPKNDGQREYDYFAALKSTLATQHGIDTEKTLFTGFSAGGMMVWQLACFRGDTFGAYAPIAGTFWSPNPNSCPSAPVHLFHTHGTSDRIVPLGGRFVTASVKQGDVLQSLNTLAQDGAYPDRTPFAVTDLTCEGATAPTGHRLEFCTHPGGHTIKAAYVERVWNTLAKMGRF